MQKHEKVIHCRWDGRTLRKDKYILRSRVYRSFFRRPADASVRHQSVSWGTHKWQPSARDCENRLVL